ncbi:hypothetical protein [Flexivirga sp. B27]
MQVYRERSAVITVGGAVVALAGVVTLGFALAGESSIGQLILGGILLVMGSLTAGIYGEVRIDARKVDLRMVPAPHRVIDIADIKSVEPIDIAPLKYGGWGWRRTGRRTTALIMRGGPGACLQLTDGSRFLVSGRLGRQLLTALR